MSDRKTHQSAALVTGTLVGLYSMQDKAGAPAIARLLGAIFSAEVGAAIPDLLNPAISSWHRGRAHSLLIAGTATQMTFQPAQWLIEIKQQLEAHAAAVRATRLALPAGHSDANSLWLDEMATEFLIGGLVGLPAGYLSHLVLDARTPRFLPFV